MVSFFSVRQKGWRQPTTMKFKITPSDGKVMTTIFWDSCGVIVIEYLARGQTTNADRYCATLRLREAIRCKRLGMLSEGVIRPHTAQTTQELLGWFKWEIWSHPISIQPRLAPSDYFRG